MLARSLFRVGSPLLTVRPVNLFRRALTGAAMLLSACGDSTNADLSLRLTGIVRHNGAPMPGATVVLIDTRGPYSAAVTLGSATADASGIYVLQAPAARDGYVRDCGTYLQFYVGGFDGGYLAGRTTLSTPIRCTSAEQQIDLTAVD